MKQTPTCWIAAPLPEGCKNLEVVDREGRGYHAVEFPDGTLVDHLLAPFWRYDDHLFALYGE